MTNQSPNPLAVASSAARAAGELIRAEYAKTQTVREKPDKSLATATDTAAEKIIIDALSQAFPTHGIFSEEIGQKITGEDGLWIIDPLDGTLNFIHHLPGVAVSIALVQNAQIALGVVYDVIHDTLFTAQRGQGAHLNGQAMHISATTDVAEAVVSFSRGSQNKERLGTTFQHLNPYIRTPRVIGSTALAICAAAAGRHDAHIAHDCYLYDCVAPALIAQEAGATIVDFTGQPWQPDLTNPTSISDLLVANDALRKALLPLLN